MLTTTSTMHMLCTSVYRDPPCPIPCLTLLMRSLGQSPHQQSAAAGGGGVSKTQVTIDKKSSSKIAAEHEALLAEHPLPGIGAGAVGALVVHSRGAREGTEYVNASAEFDAAMNALEATS